MSCNLRSLQSATTTNNRTTEQRRRTARDPDEMIAAAIDKGLSLDRSNINPHPVRRNLKQLSKERYERRWPSSDPRDLQTLKHFTELVGRNIKGRLDKENIKATTGSVREKYIKGELADKIRLVESGKKGFKRPIKPFLTIENYCNDFYNYIYKGARVNNTNLLNTYCFTSAKLLKDGELKYKLKFKREVYKALTDNQTKHPFTEQIKGLNSFLPPLFT
ncbi:hypothetical protein QBC46DRAFT_367956 [Diplogelasinospora grovesii]|uniref:Uncharacterized protein n=1 Tax=Diplogelasinospora grovesii TaxID=303347 RepID=A0AAN6MXP0_9PEZI|nr:hypothetical protein QBC46DRAFT_367956 [Diplogelasinospora grovesii]